MNLKHHMLVMRIRFELARGFHVLLAVLAFGAIGALIFAHAPVYPQTGASGKPLCLPAHGSLNLAASPLYSGISTNGAWVWWHCYLTTFTPEYPNAIQTNVYVGTVAEFSKIGGRVATITNSPEPLTTLQTAGKRFPILPLTDPSLAKGVADMLADRAQR